MANDFLLSDGTAVHLIGDPHLGKKFEEGVPLHRRGEREMGQSLTFSAELEINANIIVMVGDLFDHPYVSDSVIVAAARAVLSAADRNPNVTYVMMAGNHDKPRNLGLVGAWQAFREMTQHRYQNLVILDRPAVILNKLAIFPWEWDRRADEQVADLVGAEGIEAAVGHWDLSIFDGKDDHLAPVKALSDAFGDIQLWSGHYHKAAAYPVADRMVMCTGSMEAYAHGEGDLYVTLTRAEALLRNDLHDKHVRVILAPGEDEPDIDCLALTHKRVREDTSEEITESFDDFDFHRLVRERIQHRDPVVRGFIEERMAVNVHSSTEEQS